jgi:hypothetical protein
MNEFAGLAVRGNDVVPPSAHKSVVGQAQDGGGKWIAMMVIVEKPRIHASAPQRTLNRIEIHKLRV